MNNFRTIVGLIIAYGVVTAYRYPTDKGFFYDLGFHMGALIRMPLVFLGVL